MNKQKVLISGANGTTGRIIVKLLKDSEKYQPVAMIRKESQQEFFEKQGIVTVIADLEKDVTHAVEGVDKVIFAAGSKGKNVIGVDQDGAINLIDASKKESVQKFVMLSSMGADNPSVSEDLEDYLKAKQNADHHLENSGLNYTIVRPGALTDDDGSGKIELKENLKKFGEISRADVAKTLVEVLDDEVKDRQTFEILSGETPIIEAV